MVGAGFFRKGVSAFRKELERLQQEQQLELFPDIAQKLLDDISSSNR